MFAFGAPPPPPPSNEEILGGRGGQGWIQDFPKGGRANGKAWRMAVAAGRVPLKLLPCVIDVCRQLHLFMAARFLLACVLRELVIMRRYE